MVDFNIEWFQRLLDHTDEKEVLASEISDLLEGKPHSSCLEIGLGVSPYFARQLSNQFERYEIVEKRDVDVNLPEGVELVKKDWEMWRNQEKFDVVLASHVLYYFEFPHRATQQILDSVNPGGRVFFVVNGKQADYGPIKLAFAKMISKGYEFTYDHLNSILEENFRKREYTVPSTIGFTSPEDLFETLRISFDNYPEEYEQHRQEMLDYMRRNIPGNKFKIDQKIIEVEK